MYVQNHQFVVDVDGCCFAALAEERKVIRQLVIAD